jgi:hypothetical protein
VGQRSSAFAAIDHHDAGTRRDKTSPNLGRKGLKFPRPGETRPWRANAGRRSEWASAPRGKARPGRVISSVPTALNRETTA